MLRPDRGIEIPSSQFGQAIGDSLSGRIRGVNEKKKTKTDTFSHDT